MNDCFTADTNVFPMPNFEEPYYFWSKPSEVIYSRLSAGVEYLVRELSGLWLFRAVRNDIEEWTYFLTGIQADQTPIPQSKFDEAVRKGDFGRFIGYHIELSLYYPHKLCHIGLAPTGAGVAIHEAQQCEFRWEPEWSPGDVRVIAPEDVEVLCARIFQERVNPLLEDPYVNQEERETNLSVEFIRGSREELTRIATWIIHSELKLFANNDTTQAILYFSSVAGEDVEDTHSMHPFHGCTARIRRLIELAFEYNTFTGIDWLYQDMNDDRQSGWKAQSLVIGIAVQRPSEHERAEALLSLAEWLKGKVPEAEQKTLLEKI